MNTLPQRRRGEPLVVFSLIVACWIGLRIATWHPAIAETPIRARAAPLLVSHPAPPELPSPVRANDPVARMALVRMAGVTIDRFAPIPLRPQAPAFLPSTPPVASAVAPGLAGGHAMMWLAAVAHMPSPDALLEAVRRTPPSALQIPFPAAPEPRREARPDRSWSGDAWALVRRGGGGGGGTAGPGGATYGGDQVGAVLRYRLASGPGHRPTAYLRVSAALGGSGDREAALGLSARPIPGLPVMVAGEGRLGHLAGRIVVRPAAMAVTEIAPIALSGKVRAEFYAQAGYVAGAGATAFADGQLRVDRRVARTGGIELRAGAGAWGGVQRGAARFDIGPGATLGLAKGTAAARIALDWRFRLAGAAEPTSGPALTVSAGF